MKRVIAACAAALLVLGGCSSIPKGGEVQSSTIQEDRRDPQARIDPEGPSAGDTSSEIVKNFISAGAGPSENFKVARSFLTESVTASWNPLDGVTILPRTIDPAEIATRITSDQQNVALTVPVQGAVDANGVYRAAQPGSETKLEFKLRQQNGEWRISGAPDGIVLSAASFQSLYQSYPLYFYDTGRSYFVPENRWFLQRSSVATDITNALLQGPSEWLSGAVVSAVPEGTRLSSNTVVVDEGVATIDLDEGGRGLSDDEYSLLKAQVEASLEKVSTISSIELEVSNNPVETRSSRVAQRIVQVDSRPVVVSNGRLARLSGTRLEPVPDSPDLKAERGSRPTVAIDERSYAYLSEGGKALNVFSAEDGSSAVVFTGDDLVAPSIDISNHVWTAERDNDGSLEVSGPEGEHNNVSMPFLKGREVRAVEVSRDGTRLVVLSRTSQGEDMLEVIGINRNEDGLPVGLSPAPLEVGTAFESVTDISWGGPDSLVVLAVEGKGEDVAPWSLPLGGLPESLGEVSQAQTITAANDSASVRVASSDGTISSRVGGSWQSIVDVVATDPSYPG